MDSEPSPELRLRIGQRRSVLPRQEPSLLQVEAAAEQSQSMAASSARRRAALPEQALQRLSAVLSARSPGPE
jgi:hypothetical protein